MTIFTDQTGRNITLEKIPQRIISLVPSQTELLFDLGLNKEVIGITKFCVHPNEWFRNKTRVGGTKQLNFELIHQLKPELIIANKEENVKEHIEELAAHYPVWVSDVNNLTDAYEMITRIGEIVNKEESAQLLIERIKTNFSELITHNSQLITGNSKLRTAYLIWRSPYMTVGGDTFIHSIMMTAGFENIYADKNRYPEITIEQLHTAGCQLLLLSSEPFPFKQKHIEELQPQLPDTKIILVDGEMFSWYGSRLMQTANYFVALFEKIKIISA